MKFSTKQLITLAPKLKKIKFSFNRFKLDYIVVYHCSSKNPPYLIPTYPKYLYNDQ